jgi:3-hydroxyisobutyrate dehydrogenase
MRAGFIGLGHLGRAMAARLISEGVELVIWNRTRQKAAGLGAEVAESPASLAGKADFIFINVFDSAAVESVMDGKGGLAEAALSGKTIIDTTTNHFGNAVTFHDRIRRLGGSYLESPVLGSVVPASKGALTVLVSGEKEAYEGALPYIRKIGEPVFYLGEPGLAVRMKLINNLVLGCLMASLAEALAFAEEAGLQRGMALDILAAGAGNSAVLNAKKEKLLKGDFSTHFSSALMHKDLHLMHELAWEMKRPLLTGYVKEIFAMAYEKGIEGLDFSGVYELLKGPGAGQ